MQNFRPYNGTFRDSTPSPVSDDIINVSSKCGQLWQRSLLTVVLNRSTHPSPWKPVEALKVGSSSVRGFAVVSRRPSSKFNFWIIDSNFVRTLSVKFLFLSFLVRAETWFNLSCLSIVPVNPSVTERSTCLWLTRSTCSKRVNVIHSENHRLNPIMLCSMQTERYVEADQSNHYNYKSESECDHFQGLPPHHRGNMPFEAASGYIPTSLGPGRFFFNSDLHFSIIF